MLGLGSSLHPSLLQQGEFVDNVYSGHGIYTFADGSIYAGPFVNNQMHGAGSFTDTQVHTSLTPSGSTALAPNLVALCRPHFSTEQGIVWKGNFYNGSGPGLPGTATVTAS